MPDPNSVSGVVHSVHQPSSPQSISSSKSNVYTRVFRQRCPLGHPAPLTEGRSENRCVGTPRSWSPAYRVDSALSDRNRLTARLRFIWAIPAAIFAAVVVFVAEIVWLIAAVAILFTGSWPAGMRDFVVKAIRLSTQANAYALLLTDEYPPFALTD